MTHTELKLKVQSLLDAPSSNPTVKEFAKSWLAAEGTDKQAQLTKELVSVAKQNIALIDETIGFMGSPMAADLFGADKAKAMEDHAKDIKAHGAQFCDCPACLACKDIIDHEKEI